ncbi:Panacea domain-containing protein [Brachyspira aalborgi]|uniref:DUF4065 domain-containing protein n=1 Tax=Brachyspira aalborgi TaxID=29522 RepID=A0A5C8ET04_9SPIR|nr:type II toxin-antitoxin system antitoxin SocA domain-containing protein [Brachyspira aalborgi]TXJ39330.1 DUF4065 domain-containing protein [Brachyspira aalborgi]
MDALYVAKIIINKCYEDKIDLTITKLHKLLYVIYGAYLVIKEKKLFEELPACFRYGPIFKSVQKEYKSDNLKLDKKYNIDTITCDNILDIIISKILDTFGKSSGTALSKWSHREGSAWNEAYKDDKYWGNDIKEEYIRKEFNTILG